MSIHVLSSNLCERNRCSCPLNSVSLKSRPENEIQSLRALAFCITLNE